VNCLGDFIFEKLYKCTFVSQRYLIACVYRNRYTKRIKGNERYRYVKYWAGTWQSKRAKHRYGNEKSVRVRMCLINFEKAWQSKRAKHRYGNEKSVRVRMCLINFEQAWQSKRAKHRYGTEKSVRV
jgi:hypothetical protein